MDICIDTGFVRDKCYNRTLELLANGTLATDDAVFMRDAAGQPMSHANNLTLTIQGCKKLCGPKRQWYSDMGPRLSIWLLPVLLLISNVELSPLDKRRFCAIVHLLGDPLHTFWSLIDKLDSVDRCYRLAERYEPDREHCRLVLATVLAGFEEIKGPGVVSQTNFRILSDEYRLTDRFREWRQAAFELADSRTDEFFRTCLAILLFIYQLIAGFVKEVGGENSSPPGGRVATGVLLSWLIPTVLLSNAIGNFPSRYTCFDILSRFARRTGGHIDTLDSQSVLLQDSSRLARVRQTSYFQSLAWSGGIHTFRQGRNQARASQGTWLETASIIFLSGFPVCSGMLGGFLILWYLIPSGLNCRHTWMIGVFIAWLLSTLITKVSHRASFVTGIYHWYFVLVKDALIAGPSVTIIFLSACGLFNDCNCWGGYLYYRRNGRVALNTHPFFEHKNRTIYPLIFGVCLAAQFLLLGTIAILWRRGFRVLRWSESAKKEERERVAGNTPCPCMNKN